MLILALDTSGDTCSVAVAREGRSLAEYSFAHERMLTERLPGIIAFVLSDAGVSLDEIEGFAVGIGPGSFTGVRVGVTMAKTWAEVFQKPLYGVSSLEALAASVVRESGVVVAFVPSRAEEVIALAADSRGPVAGPRVLSTVELGSWGQAIQQEQGASELTFVSEHLRLLDGEDRVCIEASVRAATIATYADERHRVHDPATLTPLYVAPPPIRGNLSPSALPR